MGRLILTLPRLGETMEEARVTDWLVPPGADYRRGDVLLEVETDKTVVEVPALADGRMVVHLVTPGDTVALDQPIAEVDQEGAAPEPPVPQAAPSAPAPAPKATTAAVAPPSAPVARRDGLRASPRARAAARRAGLDLRDLPGTGRNGRVTAADVARFGTGLGGGRPTAVLLHGLFDSARGWRDLPARLARAGFAVIAPDLPGHDGTPAASVAAIVAALMADLPPGGPLTLIGHSLGAAVATGMAAALGPRVTRLVLIAPAGLGAAPDGGFLSSMMAATTPEALAEALAHLDAGPVGPLALRSELDRLAALRPALAPLVASLPDLDIRDALAGLACDIRVLWGTADRILPWQAVASLPPRAAIHLVAGAGHLPHHAAPDLVPHLAGSGLPAGQVPLNISLRGKTSGEERAQTPPETELPAFNERPDGPHGRKT